MNHTTFDHNWSFVSGTVDLTHMSTFLNKMKTDNEVIVVSMGMDTREKEVDYVVAFKSNNIFKDTFLNDSATF